MFAAREGYMEIIQLLMDSGADVNLFKKVCYYGCLSIMVQLCSQFIVHNCMSIMYMQGVIQLQQCNMLNAFVQ